MEFRPQTYLLWLAALLMLATPFLPIWEKASPDRIERVALTGFEMLHSRTDPAKGEVVIQQKNEYHIAFM